MALSMPPSVIKALKDLNKSWKATQFRRCMTMERLDALSKTMSILIGAFLRSNHYKTITLHGQEMAHSCLRFWTAHTHQHFTQDRHCPQRTQLTLKASDLLNLNLNLP